MAFKPITTEADLDALDQDLIVAGYRAGFHNTPDYTQRDQAYWHGYMNGQVDGHHMPISREQEVLASNLIDTGYFRRIFGGQPA